MPLHTFGHLVELDELIAVCKRWHLLLIEDAAESLGSYYKGKHTGTLGEYGAISFNGNKVITTGGMVLCNSLENGKYTKYVTTIAKVPHQYEFYHDELGFNYRMPNLNAALGCAQMESIAPILKSKRDLASQYEGFFKGSSFEFVKEPKYAQSNYWLNTVVCENVKLRDELLVETNNQGVMTWPVWQLMIRLPMYAGALRGNLSISEFLEERLVNLPSSAL